MPNQTTIEAIAYDLAPHIVTSAEIETRIAGTLKRLEVPEGQLERLTGIVERRFYDIDMKPSAAATLAARKVIEISGIDPNEIGCLINTSVCRDYLEPSVAALVQGNLGLPATCINFDIGNACLGFVNAMDLMTLMIGAGRFKYGMIVDGECSREINDLTIELLNRPDTTMQTFKDNFATLTLGSGAVAMIVANESLSQTGHIINGAVSLSATQHSRLCLGDKDNMKADPAAVLKYGVELAYATWQKASRELKNWADETIDVYIPHQVGDRNMVALNQTLGITPNKHQLNFHQLGNVGPAALPLTLSMAEEEGKVQPGNHVALMGIGSGLNCTMMSVSW